MSVDAVVAADGRAYCTVNCIEPDGRDSLRPPNCLSSMWDTNDSYLCAEERKKKREINKENELKGGHFKVIILIFKKSFYFSELK